MRIFSELYFRNLINTLFYLLFGTSSTIGTHLLITDILHNNLIAIASAAAWAFLLIMIYSYIVARRENQYLLLAQSFDFHRTLRPDNRIGAVIPTPIPVPPPVPAVTTPEQVKPNFSKIEIQHTMEPMNLEEKKPDWLKDDKEKNT